MDYEEYPKALEGQIVKRITHTPDEINFHMSDGSTVRMHHEQACCEDVRIEDICGDLDDLCGTQMLVAEEREDPGNFMGVALSEWDESFTWTFYEFRTIKGSVTIRWYGTSNGYYSERVDWARYTTE